ncbi:MAG: hypothetical protein NTV80_11725, partial [Verrucomicrobia bacterium]|nr:hypothetical protein [Verrucomicrobiota bacterium]
MSVRATVSVIALATLGLISYLGLNTSQPNSLSIPVPKKLTSSPSLKATLASRLAGGGQDSESRKQASLILEIKKDIERSKMLAADLALQDTPEKHQAAIQGMI